MCYNLSRSLPSQVALIGTSRCSKANLLTARLDRKHITADFCCHIDCLTCSSVNVCLGYLSKCVYLDARLGYGFETYMQGIRHSNIKLEN